MKKSKKRGTVKDDKKNIRKNKLKRRKRDTKTREYKIKRIIERTR